MKRFLFSVLLAAVGLVAHAQYKVDKMDGRCYMAAASIVDGVDDDDLFANIVLWAQQAAGVPGLNFLKALDYNAHHMELLKVDVYGGIIKFRVEDIVLQTVVIMSPKQTPFERLQPEKKSAHQAAIEEFEVEESKLLSAMIDFAKTNSLPPIRHWAEIKAGKIVLGMSELECQLAVGKPRIVIDGDELQWQLNSSTYIFFKQGVVSSIVK